MKTLLTDTFAVRRPPADDGLFVPVSSGREPLARPGLRVLQVAVVALVAVALRLFMLGNQSLWTDEIVTFRSSDGPLWWVISQTEYNSNIPPLYYVLTSWFLNFGNSEVVLRLPSVICGALSIPLLYLIAFEWFGSSVALLSIILFAVSPFEVWYSQEARPYALLLFLGLLAMWSMLRVIRRPGDIRMAVVFVLSAAATVYCHTVGVAFIAFLAAYMALAAPRRLWRRWLAYFACIVVLLIPAAVRLLSLPPAAAADSERQFSLLFVPYAGWAFAAGYSLGPTLTQLHMPDRVSTVVHSLPVLLPCLALVGTLAALGLVELWRHRSIVRWGVVLLFAIPTGFVIGGTLVTVHPFNVRYMILAFPAFVFVMALGVLRLKRRPWLVVGACGGLMLMSLASLGNYYFDPRYYREDNRAAGQVIHDQAQPGDLVLANAAYTADNIRFYAARDDIQVLGFPVPDSEAQASPSTSSPLRTGGVPTPVVAPSAELPQILAGRDRFWLFLSRTYQGGGVEGSLLQACEQDFEGTTLLTTPNDVRVLLCEKR
ncbi:MAG: glycosyltransferase family 39 protein [Chloroflexi bacterium]|nr:glycosyltransferase family 39 protein [Chloroflexota bacterium]